MENKKNRQRNGFFADCLKEFKRCAIIVIAYILFSCIVSWILGYSQSGEEIPMIAGIPTWVVFGVIIPWAFMVCLAAYFGFKGIREEDEE